MVVVLGRSRGRDQATGEAFDVRAVHVWTLRGGRAIRLEVYLDTSAMRRHLR